MSFISSFKINKVVVLDPNMFSCIPTSAADAAAVNPKGIKTLLANGLITLFIDVNPVFSNQVIHQVIYQILQIELL